MASLLFLEMNYLTKILKPLFVRMSLLMSVMFISSTSLPAQSYNTSSSKAIKYFEKARQEFLCKNYDEALLNVDKALQKDDEFAMLIC